MRRSRSAGFGSVKRRFATYGYATYINVYFSNKHLRIWKENIYIQIIQILSIIKDCSPDILKYMNAKDLYINYKKLQIIKNCSQENNNKILYHLKKFKIWLKREADSFLSQQRTNNKRKSLRNANWVIIDKLIELPWKLILESNNYHQDMAIPQIVHKKETKVCHKCLMMCLVMWFHICTSSNYHCRSLMCWH